MISSVEESRGWGKSWLHWVGDDLSSTGLVDPPHTLRGSSLGCRKLDVVCGQTEPGAVASREEGGSSAMTTHNMKDGAVWPRNHRQASSGCVCYNRHLGLRETPAWSSASQAAGAFNLAAGKESAGLGQT